MCIITDTASINIGTLFLEDEEEVHKKVKDTLQEIGWRNYRFHDDTSEFLEDLDSNINICVIDGVDGIEILKTVKIKNKWSFVIVFSGQNNKQTVIDYLNAGADRYVDKSNKKIDKYVSELIMRLKEGLEIAKERIEIVSLLKNA